MGLTIHYDMKVSGKKDILPLVKQMRSFAMDLPFEEVGEVHQVHQNEMPDNRSEAYHSHILGSKFIKEITIPWTHVVHHYSKGSSTSKSHSTPVKAEQVVGFNVWPGDGSESFTINLARFPKTTEVEYKPEDDRRFLKFDKSSRWPEWYFASSKWRNWCDKNLPAGTPYDTGSHVVMRTLKVPGNGNWIGGDFCKTEYASNPECGGMPNFIKCHVAVIRFLDKIGELPGVKVKIDDEGHFGPAHYSDDHVEARAAGRKPTYVDHPATYDVKVLADQCGNYNELIAAGYGMMKDTGVESPISNYPNFEQLEFRGLNNGATKGFFEHLATLAQGIKEQATAVKA
jgi:hypothetical protein